MTPYLSLTQSAEIMRRRPPRFTPPPGPACGFDRPARKLAEVVRPIARDRRLKRLAHRWRPVVC